MLSKTTERFRQAFDKLPLNIKKEARRIFNIWKSNPYQKNLRYKKIHGKENIYSIRIGISWRALGVKKDDKIIWFWIGSHSDYDNMMKSF